MVQYLKTKRGYFYKITPNTHKKNREKNPLISHEENKTKYKNKKFEHLKLIFETKPIDFYLYFYNIAYNGVTHIHIFFDNIDKKNVKLHNLCITYKHKGKHYINIMTGISSLERQTFIRASSLSKKYNINTILDYCEEFLYSCITGFIDVKNKYKETSSASPSKSLSPFNSPTKSPTKKRAESGIIYNGVPISKYRITPVIPNCAPVVYNHSYDQLVSYNKWDATNLEFTE